MQLKKIRISALSLALACAAATAWADEVTDTFVVQMDILASCAVTAGVVADFGPVGHASQQNTAETTLLVKCSMATPYQISLRPTNASADGIGALQGPGGSVPYALYQDAAFTTPWGSVLDVSTRSGVGTGAEEPYTVYLRNLNANFVPGTYVDTVAVAVTY